MNYRLSLFAATLVFLIGFGAQLAPHSASAQTPKPDPKYLTRSSFRPDSRANINSYRLYDGDVIMMTIEEDNGIPADEIEIVLRTDPNVTWWKSITVEETYPTNRGRKFTTVNSISVQDDDHGPKAMRQNFAQVNDSVFNLVFAKAKILGVHTEMYTFPGWEFAGLNGKRVIFTWQKD